MTCSFASPFAARLAAAMAALVAFSAPAAEAGEDNGYGTIAVVGQGSVTATPDSAEVQVAVVTVGEQAAAAVAANSAQMTNVLRRLAELGIEERHTATERFEIAPRFRRSPNQEDAPQIAGYVVINRLRVVVADIKILGQALDAVVAAGANRIDSVSMTLSDVESLLDQARKKAIADARRKAELIVAAAGLKLGPVLSIEEQGSALPEQRFLAMVETAAVPVRPGKQVVRAGLAVTFSIDGPTGQ